MEELYAIEFTNSLMEDALLIALKTLKSIIYYRYYHVFCEGELEALIKRIKTLKILISTYDCANWHMIVEKKDLKNL